MKNKKKKKKIVGSSALPNASDNAVVRGGQQAWKSLKETGRTSWENWKIVGKALMVGRRHAMEVSKTKPNGKRYSDAFNFWMQGTGFDDIHKSDRAKLLQIMEDLPRIEKWLATKTPGERASWNHPSTIWRVSRCKDRGINAVNKKAKSTKTESERLAAARKKFEENDAKFEEDDVEVNWQLRLADHVRKEIGNLQVPDCWLLDEPPDRGLITSMDELISAATALRDYLQQVHDSWLEESASQVQQHALEDAA